MTRPVLQTVAPLIERHRQSCHPGLWLDRFAMPGDQENQKREIDAVIRCGGALSNEEFKHALQRRQDTLSTVAAQTFTAATTGPFTLHLARAAALENAGLCLHPVYGFPCIPGSALKGMARAFAETVWKHQQKDRQHAESQILEVFGDIGATGAIVFHEAWPEKPPRLFCDIVNSHHPDYYAGKADEAGDWESPNPVYFLAIPAGTTFCFALAPRQTEHADLLPLAFQWLAGALIHLGAGAKTNAGYGRFRISEIPEGFQQAHDAIPAPHSETFTLELQTPAFFAGAQQNAGDCDLRPASLRGQLRWWWRTLQAGKGKQPEQIKEDEERLWGSSDLGGLVSLSIRPLRENPVVVFDKNAISKQHGLVYPPDKKTAQGTTYLSFGMDDNKKENDKRFRVQRHCMAPFSSWEATLVVKSVEGETKKSDFEEAREALALFINYGGIGAKARNGFGSLACPDLNRPAIPGGFLDLLEIQTPWKDPWFVLDQLGFSYQAFSQQHKHQLGKRALGLPRNIGEPQKGQFSPGAPLAKKKEKDWRHPSPFFFHLQRDPDAHSYNIRVAALPSAVLPNLEESRKMLQALLEHLKQDLEKRVSEHKDKGQSKPPTPAPLEPPAAPTVQKPPQSPTQRFLDSLMSQHPAANYRWDQKHNHQELVKALEECREQQPDIFPEVAEKYRQAIYGQLDKKARKKEKNNPSALYKILHEGQSG